MKTRDLENRLLSATEGSRVLDEMIVSFVGVVRLPYTTSIDAALTLVPDGWHWQLRDDPSCFHAGLHRGTIPNIIVHHGEGKTPALAVCVAALKATAAR